MVHPVLAEPRRRLGFNPRVDATTLEAEHDAGRMEQRFDRCVVHEHLTVADRQRMCDW